MKCLTIQFAVAMAMLVFAAKVGAQEMEEPQHFCGRKLAETLSVLCYENYENSEKRSLVPYNSVFDDEAPRYYPWVPRHHARVLGLPGRGKRQYIVDECCKKACTLRKLTEYC